MHDDHENELLDALCNAGVLDSRYPSGVGVDAAVAAGAALAVGAAERARLLAEIADLRAEVARHDQLFIALGLADAAAPPLNEDPVAIALGLAEPANDEVAAKAAALLARVQAAEHESDTLGPLDDQAENGLGDD